MSPDTDRAFGELTPEFMLDALEAAGLRGDGRMLQLNSYENRVMQVHLEDGRVAVAKFYRPGRWSDAQILEEHAFAAELAEAEVPVARPWTLAHSEHFGLPQGALALLGMPATLGRIGMQRFAVASRQGGRAPELEDVEVLRWIGRLLARLHEVGARRPFEHRVRWWGAEPGETARAWLMGHGVLPPEIAARWDRVARDCLAHVTSAFEALGEVPQLRLHGDCHPGNILWTPDRGPHFVDLDDAVTGPAVQDLWMLLSGDEATARWQWDALMDGYESIRSFDWRERRLIEPLRTLRMIHHSAWLARRWGDPAFPLAFPWFGTPNYWNDQVAKLAEQLEAMQSADEGGTPPSPFKDDDDFHLDGDSFS